MEEVFTHPKYKKLAKYNHDVMLLKLAEHVDMKKYAPVCLPKVEEDFIGRMGSAYGENKIFQRRFENRIGRHVTRVLHFFFRF